jgi:alkanesulfonate monooxygenase SsuD/methylene tetrahydromethanopterin reductase-like flavin-dependent oxidoreductase (luciferase family)
VFHAGKLQSGRLVEPVQVPATPPLVAATSDSETQHWIAQLGDSKKTFMRATPIAEVRYQTMNFIDEKLD